MGSEARFEQILATADLAEVLKANKNEMLFLDINSFYLINDQGG